MYESGHLKLSAMMGTYPKTEALKQGAVTSPGLTLEFAPVDVAQKAFKDVVRHVKYDVSEIAIVTFLQAFAAGKPYVLLPFVMNGNFHHKSVLCRKDDDMQPGNLSGRRIAMRAYTQTTPTWVRGILGDDYGMQLQNVRWFSQEGAHVADYADPAWVQHIDSKLNLEQMLLGGEVDGIIAGSGLGGDERIRTLIANPKQAALDWYARHRAVPINHMVAVRRELATDRPDLVREIFRMLQQSRRATGDQATADGIDLQPVGFEPIQPALEMISRFAFEQKLTGRNFAPEELYGPVVEALA